MGNKVTEALVSPQLPGAEPSAAELDATPFPCAGPVDLCNAVLAALRGVVDPEVALSIVDMGLVYGVAIDDDTASVELTMTTSACPVTHVIVEDVQAALDRVLPEHLAIDVKLVWQPPWTPARMSERARAFMGR